MADISHISIPSYNIDGDINDTVARTTINNHVADKNNPHNVTKAQIGLGNVDNTSDMNKPISTAVQNALDKVDREFFKLVPRGAMRIPSGDYKNKIDLNNYIKVGTYYNYSSTHSNIDNGPYDYDTSNFIMYIMSPVSESYDDEAYYEEKDKDSIEQHYRLRIFVDAYGTYVQETHAEYEYDDNHDSGSYKWKFNNWNKIADNNDVDWAANAILHRTADRYLRLAPVPDDMNLAHGKFGLIDDFADLNDNSWMNVGTYYNIHKKDGRSIYNCPVDGNFIMYVIGPIQESDYEPMSVYTKEAKYGQGDFELDHSQIYIPGTGIYEETETEEKVYRVRILIHINGSAFVQSAVGKYIRDSTILAMFHYEYDYGPWVKIANSNDLSAVKKIIDDHITNKSNPHGVTKDQVGLNNVDNTADKDKSVKYADSAGSANSVAWDNVSGKPSTYPPSSHTHTKDQVGLDNVDNTADKDKSVKYAESAGSANSVAWDNVTNKPTTMASSVAWDDVTNKPSTYPPSSHTHTPEEVGLGNVDNTADKDKSVKYAESAGSVDSIAWDDVMNKPSTYPPDAHTHTPEEVGLGNVANLDQSKAIKSITRNGTTFTATALDGTTTTFTQQDADTTSIAWDDVMNKPSTYPPDAHTHTPAEVGLGNVDNTADKDKPISTAVQKALNGKANNSVATSSADGLMSKSDKAKLDSIEAGSNVESVNGKTGIVDLSKADIGLGNVDNTADKDKSVKYATTAGTANSVAWDDISGKPTTFDSSVSWENVTDKPSTYPPSSHTHTPAEVGLGNVDNTADSAKSVKYAASSGSANSVAWKNVSDKPSTYPPSSHTHTPAEVGLGNVDNTADKDKPVSTAVQNALNNKVTKNNTADTNGLLNSLDTEETTPTDADYYISQHAGGGTTTTTYHRRPMSALWTYIKSKCDSIYATVSALNTHIANKSNPHGVTKAQIGLGNVDNTSDANKPISTAVQKALDSKANNSVATSSADGLMSKSDKAKLDGLKSGGNVESVNGKTGAVTLTKNDVGLGNVDNTADKDKSVKYATTAGTANSVAWGNVSGKPSTYPPSSHTHTPAQVGLGNVANLDQSKAIKSITRNGTTFTATALDGTTSTFTQQDINTTYGLASQSSNGLMSAADKKAVDREFFKLTPRGGTYIPAKADLNSIQYLKVGTYYNSLAAESATMKNCPGSAFIMYVLSPLSESYDNESTSTWVYRLRIFVEYTGNIFTQFVYSGNTVGSFSYGPWVKMTNSNDLGAVSNTINGHTSNKSNPHGVTKAQVGLGNVDNTADKDKSVKYAASAGSANSVAWGNVSGKPSTYPPSSHTHTPAQVGLGNVDNTADKDKSVKYATSADTVDGLHEYSFLRYRDATSTNGTETLWNQIGIREYDAALPSGLSGVYNYGAVVSLPGGNTRFDLYYNHQASSNGDGLYYRTGWGTDKKRWVHLIDSQSIGSQSVKYAASAGSATRATQDSSGQQINTTYIKSLSVSGRTITYTRGNGSTGSITTQDTNTTYDILNSVYPVGSIYMSMTYKSPASFLGGTWQQITNSFLFAAGSGYAAGVTGGEYNHTLTMAEMPNHAHSIHGVLSGISPMGGGTDHTFSVSYTSLNERSSTVGGDLPHNNMPPYLVVYMWKRTA